MTHHDMLTTHDMLTIHECMHSYACRCTCMYYTCVRIYTCIYIYIYAHGHNEMESKSVKHAMLVHCSTKCRQHVSRYKNSVMSAHAQRDRQTDRQIDTCCPLHAQRKMDILCMWDLSERDSLTHSLKRSLTRYLTLCMRDPAERDSLTHSLKRH